MLLARVVTGGDSLTEVIVACAAVLGSVRSVFLRFSGGRGVGTGVGTMLVIQPLAVILAAPVFFLVILATRYVSLGSLLGSAAMFPARPVWAVAAGGFPVLPRLGPSAHPDLAAPQTTSSTHPRNQRNSTSVITGTATAV